MCFRISLACVFCLQLGGAFKLPQHEHPSTSQFRNFMTEHGRQYAHDSDEYHLRFASFVQRLAEIERQNSQPNRRWTAGTTSLSDQTAEEFQALLGWRRTASPSRGGASLMEGAASRDISLRGKIKSRVDANKRRSQLPEAFMNWTHLNASTRIRNQGGCGSCWAVAGATVLDMHNEIHRPSDGRTFSARELVSCVENPHNCGGQGGCRGATVELAYEFVMNHGLSTEQQEPYAPKEGICSKTGRQTVSFFSPGNIRTQQLVGLTELGMSGWSKLPENKYEPLLRAVMEHGPTAVSVGGSGWSNYVSGVFDGCSPDIVIDHAVVLVGFGYDKELGAKFYNIQNSWGDGWGEGGHIRLLRKDDDETEQCGIDHRPDEGTGCDGGPPMVKVCGMCGVLYDSVVPFFNKS